ncbi:valine--tRNA ligase [Portibacter lacus]|uniref:Valine--tRNA ligase n=1 Tax=Portibacter lacus TaxID=1099794 RepID=A0AA37SKA0_9BACT|nr:valine--tRNA ligase [Portibacter lacus]GLR15542.1 valine--tRNA ligase [Portibacter lacus]
MKLSTEYSPVEVEDKWYAHWEAKGYFHSEPDEREAFSVVIPPPNVTGMLHMGHMLNNTIQDILIRKAKLDGKNACWVPGTDHASIATEAKVVRMLREQGIKKSDLTREGFLEHAWEWKEKYGGIILQQLRKLGASCDWDRTAFTMDEERSKAVMQVFVDLYNKGKLYRGLRMVNWDPEAKTVLSNEEVLYKDEQSHIYHVRYQIEGSEDFVTIATTRPETILGDSAIAVHPDDSRYTFLHGKRAIVPLVNRSIPIIFDEYVEREFGTGALKVTPAHDVNDYEIGKRHELEVIEVLNDDGTINENGGLAHYVGKSRFKVRTEIVKELESSGNLVEIKPYAHNVGRSERTNAVVEPKLSLQWYVDMKSLAEPALEAVMTDEVEFFPKNQKNVYKHWMENIRDWCISRQLWWGHQIPAWYYEDEVFVATTAEEALYQARAKTGNHELEISDLRQDEDVLDTWFSSWLWPMSVFDEFSTKEEIDYYYPTSVLVTGWDIIFLWVARMIMAGYEWKHERPFKHVYFTGMVRDQKRRKMSKQLGNSPDALELISQFGADGVRYGMLSSSPAGGDLLFDEKLVDQGKKFCNKLWNALRMFKNLEIDDSLETPIENKLAIEWFEQKKSAILNDLASNFDQYRLSEALVSLYSFVWTDFCSWYLEMVKPDYEKPIDSYTYEKSMDLFEDLCLMLHPFMPFITEEIWHKLKDRKEGEDCMNGSWPKATSYDKEIIAKVEKAKDVISRVREIRNKNGIKKNEPLSVLVEESKGAQDLLAVNGVKEILIKLAVLSGIEWVSGEPEKSVGFLSGTEKYYVEIEQEIDVEAEKEKLEKDLAHAEGFVNSVEKKLSNERFVNNAPEAVVAMEHKKLADGKERVRIIKASLEKL